MAHVNDELAEVSAGNTGESLDEFVENINRFTSENDGEVIFLRFRYLSGIRHIPSYGPIYWGEEHVNTFYDKIRALNNRCPNLDTNTQFNAQKMGYFMKQNNMKGCVIVLLGGNFKEVPENLREVVSDGFYNQNRMNFNDYWAEEGDTEAMAVKQYNKWNEYNRPGTSELLITQWLVSADIFTTMSYGIELLAINPTNPALYWWGVNRM